MVTERTPISRGTCESPWLGLVGARHETLNVSRLDEARAQVAALGMEPRLVLRPTGSLGGSWDVSLEIPTYLIYSCDSPKLKRGYQDPVVQSLVLRGAPRTGTAPTRRAAYYARPVAAF